VASFDTRGAAVLLSMRVEDLILRSGHSAVSRRMKATAPMRVSFPP